MWLQKPEKNQQWVFFSPYASIRNERCKVMEFGSEIIAAERERIEKLIAFPSLFLKKSEKNAKIDLWNLSVFWVLDIILNFFNIQIWKDDNTESTVTIFRVIEPEFVIESTVEDYFQLWDRF